MKGVKIRAESHFLLLQTSEFEVCLKLSAFSDKLDDLEVIYDNVKCEVPVLDETLVIPGEFGFASLKMIYDAYPLKAM